MVSAVRLAYDDKPILNTGPMLGWLNRLGEAPYNRQTPDGYPLDEATEVAVATIRLELAKPTTVTDVIFACFNSAALAEYTATGVAS